MSMLEKENIEKLLKVNGVNKSASDDEIRSVLISARYEEDEIDTAIMVLRENIVTHKTRVEGLHKVFRTSESLTSAEISDLLKIDVEINKFTAPPASKDSSVVQLLIGFFIAVLIACLTIFIAMYVLRIGIFYPSANT